MRHGPISILDRAPHPSGTAQHLASWYTPGLSDGLGDRLLMFDNTTSSSLELLRFKREFSDRPSFEAALRRRVEQLERFRHPSVANVRAVKWLGDGEGLALVSDHVAGRRLSEVLHDARGATLATELIRQLTPILVALQRQGDGIAHGVLTAERIVITPEGRLVVVEHVLGSAVESLGLPAGRLRSEFGLPVLPGRDAVAFDCRTDVVQLALVALSLVIGRRVDPNDYPTTVARLLDALPDAPGRGSSAPQELRAWLGRALQLGLGSFESAEDAQKALGDWLGDPGLEANGAHRTLAFQKPAELSAASPALWESEFPSEGEGRSEPGRDAPVTLRTSGRVEHVSSRRLERPDGHDRLARRTTMFEVIEPARLPRLDPVAEPVARPGTTRRRHASPVSRTAGLRRFLLASRSLPVGRWTTAAIAVIAVAEAFVIAGLLSSRPVTGAQAILVESPQPGVEVVVDGRRAGVTPLTLEVGSGTRSIRVVAPEPPRASVQALIPAGPPPRPKTETKPAAVVPPPKPERIGGITLSSPIELQVYEGGNWVGSTAAPIAIAAGRHELELVNDALAYRSRQTVDVRIGKTTPLTISPPNGRMSVNAVPWAEVWIDGKQVGDTPLPDLSIPLGEHEIVFKHPQLGERRQTAVVKSDGLTRVIANLQR